MATRRERPMSPTPFSDALRAVLARRYQRPWQEALELLKAGVKPSSEGSFATGTRARARDRTKRLEPAER